MSRNWKLGANLSLSYEGLSCLELRGLPEDGTPLIDVSLMDDESEDCLQLEEEGG